MTGTSGRPMELVSNYFEVVSRPDMHLLQYHVDFAPSIEHMGIRRALVRNHENVLGKYIFDGMQLYTITRLRQVCFLSAESAYYCVRAHYCLVTALK